MTEGEAWGTSKAIKGSDGVSDPSLYLFLCFYLPRYFDILASFEYQISSFTLYSDSFCGHFDLLEYLCRAEGVLDPRLPPGSCGP